MPLKHINGSQPLRLHGPQLATHHRDLWVVVLGGVHIDAGKATHVHHRKRTTDAIVPHKLGVCVLEQTMVAVSLFESPVHEYTDHTLIRVCSLITHAASSCLSRSFLRRLKRGARYASSASA